MPKAKGRNAFFFFMLDWRKRAEAQGRRFPNGLKDVTADPGCNEEWQVMSTKNSSEISTDIENVTCYREIIHRFRT